MDTELHFDGKAPLREQVSFVLSVIPEASVAEITMELTELRGIAAKEGVAELSLEVENELKKMLDKGLVREIAGGGHTKRYLPVKNM